MKLQDRQWWSERRRRILGVEVKPMTARFAPLLVLLACTDPTTAELCMEEYAPERGYGWSSDDGSEVSHTEAICDVAEGGDCDASRYMTREAAECIAIAEGLEVDSLDIDQHLDYHDDIAVPAWHLHALLQDENGRQTYHGIALNATTGEILDEQVWTEDGESQVLTSGES